MGLYGGCLSVIDVPIIYSFYSFETRIKTLFSSSSPSFAVVIKAKYPFRGGPFYVENAGEGGGVAVTGPNVVK